METERGSLETASTTNQSCVFLGLQIPANNPLISPQNGRLLLLKDTGEDSPRTEIRCYTEPFSDREMPSVLRKLRMSGMRRFESPRERSDMR